MYRNIGRAALVFFACVALSISNQVSADDIEKPPENNNLILQEESLIHLNGEKSQEVQEKVLRKAEESQRGNILVPKEKELVMGEPQHETFPKK